MEWDLVIEFTKIAFSTFTCKHPSYLTKIFARLKERVNEGRDMKAMAKARDAINAAKSSGSKLVKGATKVGRAVQGNHEKLADHADTVAKATRIAAGVAVAGATVAAPTGLTAAGVWLGVVSAPVIVTAAPVLVSAAGVVLTLSAAASLYSKAQKRKSAKDSDVDSPQASGGGVDSQ